jgi:hypothetical protein
MNPDAVVVERRIKARPATVFSFFTDRDRWLSWQGVEAEPDGADGTLLRLVHTGLPLPAVDLHRDGWNHFLDRLGVRAAGGDPGPDHSAA